MEENSENQAFPRLLRPVEIPLALYFRPGRNDHVMLAQALTEGLTGLRGIVFNPARLTIQKELLGEASQGGIGTVLDTRMMELSSGIGSRPELSSVSWAFAGKKTAAELLAGAGKQAAEFIASCVVENGFSAVLAPTHYWAGSEDQWVSVDSLVTRTLRDCLDLTGANDVPIYYPLALPSAAFRDASQRKQILSTLKDLPIDSVWVADSPIRGGRERPNSPQRVYRCKPGPSCVRDSSCRREIRRDRGCASCLWRCRGNRKWHHNRRDIRCGQSHQTSAKKRQAVSSSSACIPERSRGVSACGTST